MTALATGVDLVEIDRFHALNPAIRDSFIKRVFTPLEREEAGASIESLAGKFAAKEAAAKALGSGIGLVSWQELEILSDAQGRPVLTLHDNATRTASQAGWSSWSLSISHTRTYAVAVVTALLENELG